MLLRGQSARWNLGVMSEDSSAGEQSRGYIFRASPLECFGDRVGKRGSEPHFPVCLGR